MASLNGKCRNNYPLLPSYHKDVAPICTNFTPLGRHPERCRPLFEKMIWYETYGNYRWFEELLILVSFSKVPGKLSNNYGYQLKTTYRWPLLGTRMGTVNGCDLPKVEGTCRALIPSWYFDARTRDCEQFLYGGCGGNENRFSSKDECRDTCVMDGESVEDFWWSGTCEVEVTWSKCWSKSTQ